MAAALSAILQFGGDFAFFALGTVAVISRVRRPERTPLFLAIALGLLGMTGLLDLVTNLSDSRYPVTVVLSAVLFSASGYPLVEFRSIFVPLTRRGRRFVIAVEAVALGFAIFTGLESPGRTNLGGLIAVAAIGLIGIWIACVGDSVFRLWRASRSRPAVQRTRLRALCVGYGLIVAFLFVNVLGTGLFAGGALAADLGSLLEVLVILAAPLLYVSFAPPAWMRRLWRASEEERFSNATRDLLLFSPNVETLARRSLEWANRLVGADCGFIVDWEGRVLGVAGISTEEAAAIQARLPRESHAQMVSLGEGYMRTAILVPLSFEAGTGRLAVIAGAVTPIFGSDEVARLVVYSVAVTAALDRTRLVEAIQAVNAELESRVDERTAALRITNEELEARHDELRRLDQQRRELLQQVVTAQEEERRRIAHDLHDDAVQVMTAVNMRVGVLHDRLTDTGDREVVEKLEKTVSQAIGRLRHLLFELSPPALENHGLVTALRNRLEELTAENEFTYELRGDPEDRLDTEHRLLVYRIAQEALINVRKHAGARHVDIELAPVDGGVLVRIIDDGAGFDPEATPADRPGHLGLVGMRERAEMGGGWWRVQSRPGEGTTVEFWSPDSASRADEHREAAG